MIDAQKEELKFGGGGRSVNNEQKGKIAGGTRT